MRTTPAALAYLRDAFRRGDLDLVLGAGDRAVHELRAAGDAVGAAEARLLLAVVRSQDAPLAPAVAELTAAVDELAGLGPDARQELAVAETAELALLDGLLRAGRYDEALARLPPLLEPDRPVDTRFAATRVQAAVASVRGRPERAHQHLNTAAGLAERLRSRLRAALVEGDRAAVLAAQGRLYEAVAVADRALAALGRPGAGALPRWAATEGAVVAFVVTRRAAIGGDTMTAQHLLITGTALAERVGGRWLDAHLDLATGAYWAAEGDPYRAEACLLGARSGFAALGAEPGSAVTTLELGRLALRRGLTASAEPQLAAARDQLRALGHAPDTADADALLAHLRRGRADAPPAAGNAG